MNNIGLVIFGNFYSWKTFISGPSIFLKGGSDFVTNSYGESSDSSCEKSWVPVKKRTRSPKLKMLGPLCNWIVNLETDAKTLYYNLLKLKYLCIFKQQPQKSFEQDILPRNLQINIYRLFFPSSGMHAMNYIASLGIFMRQGRRMHRTKGLFMWKWGTPGSWGNPPVYIISHINLITFTW